MLMAACGVSAVVINDGHYRALWKKDWQSAIADAKPWNPSVGSAGACNKGGTLQACFDTDAAVIPDLKRLLQDLQGAAVPSEFSQANDTLRRAIQTDMQALQMRNDAIKTNNDAEFSAAVDEVTGAGRLFQTGYTQFPNFDRPTPAPFGGGLIG